MNLKYAILFSVLLIALRIPGVLGQVVVQAHVTAEVVESVSASAKINSSFEIKSSGSAFQDAAGELSDLDLGTLTVRTGKNMTCNLMVKPALLTDASGQGFTVDPDVTTRNNSSQDTRTLRIKGKARPSGKELSGGLYKGSYTMVFAYN